jgi:hypothetical protein
LGQYSPITVKRAALGFAAFLVSATLARATLLLDDCFGYPDGPLVTVSTNAWVHHSPSGSNTGEVMVASSRVLLNEDNQEDVHALFAGSSGDAGVLYASFTVKFTSLPGGGGAYFAHFKSASTTGFRARLWALPGGAAPDRFRLGISSASGSVISATNAADLRLNTDYLVVTRLVDSNSAGTFWINPASEDDPGVSTAEDASSFVPVSYAFRESDNEGALNIGHLRVGTALPM